MLVVIIISIQIGWHVTAIRSKARLIVTTHTAGEETTKGYALRRVRLPFVLLFFSFREISKCK